MYAVVFSSGTQADLGETCEFLLRPSSGKKKNLAVIFPTVPPRLSGKTTKLFI